MLKPCAILGLLFLLSSCKQPPEGEKFVPVIGLNSDRMSDVKYVPITQFNRQMSPFIGGIAHEVSKTLDQHEMTDAMPWDLSRVTVGLALAAEFELIEEILEAEVHGDIELRFQKFNPRGRQ
jgi:hypothetical protein